MSELKNEIKDPNKYESICEDLLDGIRTLEKGMNEHILDSINATAVSPPPVYAKTK
jgi:hypothetical protein